PPYVQTVQFENGNLANPSQGRPAAQAPFGSILAFDPHLDMPYTLNYSLGIQREMPQGFLVEASYVGSLGRHLIREPDFNHPDFTALIADASHSSSQQLAVNALRPYKGYSSILMQLSDSTSNYHALQLYTSKRSGNLLLTAGYTWSKALTDSSNESDNPENP